MNSKDSKTFKLSSQNFYPASARKAPLYQSSQAPLKPTAAAAIGSG